MTDEELMAQIRRWSAEEKLVIGRDHWEAALRLLEARDREIAALWAHIVELRDERQDATDRADKAEAERDAALARIAEELCRLSRAEFERDRALAQVAAMREALRKAEATVFWMVRVNNGCDRPCFDAESIPCCCVLEARAALDGAAPTAEKGR